MVFDTFVLWYNNNDRYLKIKMRFLCFILFVIGEILNKKTLRLKFAFKGWCVVFYEVLNKNSV